MSLMWMMNVEAGFADKECKTVNFKDLKWRVPLEALTKVQLNKDKEYVVVSVFFNEQKQNDILVAAGYKMVKKNKEKRNLLIIHIKSFSEKNA